MTTRKLLKQGKLFMGNNKGMAVIIFFGLLCLMLSCKPLSDNKKEEMTIHNVLAAANKNDYKAIMYNFDKNAKPPIFTDTEFVQFHTIWLYYFLTKFHHNKIDNIHWVIQDSVNDVLGRKMYIINLFNGFDSTTGAENVNLNLFFGPKTLFPNSKLTGFEVDNKLDIDYRGELQKEGKLKIGEELLDVLKN